MEDLQKLANKGVKVEGLSQVISPALKAKSAKVHRKKPKPLTDMEQILFMLGVKYETEHMFLEGRKYRFDIAIIDHKIGIEYEGLMSEKSRHTTVTGYTGDCTKYNLAQIAGWRVLRYTAINHKEFIHEIKKILSL